jgi:hypothetical protein
MAQQEFLPKPLVAHVMEFTGGRENAWEIMDWVRKDGYQASWRDAGSAQTVTIDRGEDYIVMHLGEFLVRSWEAKYEHLVPTEFHKRYEPKKV